MEDFNFKIKKDTDEDIIGQHGHGFKSKKAQLSAA